MVEALEFLFGDPLHFIALCILLVIFVQWKPVDTTTVTNYDRDIPIEKLNIKAIPTCELVEELRSRDGVKTNEYKPYEKYTVEGDGPVIVLQVED